MTFNNGICAISLFRNEIEPKEDIGIERIGS